VLIGSNLLTKGFLFGIFTQALSERRLTKQQTPLTLAMYLDEIDNVYLCTPTKEHTVLKHGSTRHTTTGHQRRSKKVQQCCRQPPKNLIQNTGQHLQVRTRCIQRSHPLHSLQLALQLRKHIMVRQQTVNTTHTEREKAQRCAEHAPQASHG